MNEEEPVARVILSVVVNKGLFDGADPDGLMGDAVLSGLLALGGPTYEEEETAWLT